MNYNNRCGYKVVEGVTPLMTVRGWIWEPCAGALIKFPLIGEACHVTEIDGEVELKTLIIYRYTGRRTNFGKQFGIRCEYEYIGIEKDVL